MDRSNAEGVPLRNLCEETTRVSTSHEVELQGQLQKLHQENARINDLMNQIQITNDSMNIRNQGLAQKLQTSHFELSRAQAGVSHLRTSVERNQSTENRDAGGKNNSVGRENLR